MVRSILSRKKQKAKDFDIVANPEFLMGGRGLLDFHYPDRTLIGASSERAKCIIRSLYEQVIQGITPGLGPGTTDHSHIIRCWS